MALLRTESKAARQARLEKAVADLHNANAASGERENAVEQIAGETDPELIGQLAKAFVGSTPPVQQAIVDALFSRRDRLGTVVAALESDQIPASALNAVQRQMLLEHSDPAIQKRAEAALRSASTFDPKAAEKYLAALKGKRDIAHGETVFREKCAACHQVRSIGHMVGPNLEAEFQRAEETYVKDILAPSETISPGYTTYNVVTDSGTIVSGVLAAETPSSITVRQPGGKSQVILRKDIDPEVGLRASRVSTMPDSLSRELTPQDVADVIAWLRSPSTTLVLLDGGPSSMSVLTAGDGKAQVVEEAHKSGGTAIRILPPGRHCAKIENWHYPIRKNPGPGQYRYLRFHWQAEGADGAMIELASDGHWGPSTSPQLRYFAGKSPAGHQGIQVATEAPQQWTTVTRDLWKDFGDTTLTGISFIPGDKPMLIGRVELLQADD
jgi:putative heme-binding domain-containing protein